MYILEPKGYRELNTKTGDMIYDAAGKDRVTPYLLENEGKNFDLVLSNGKIFVLYTRDGDKTYSLSSVSYNMYVSEPEYTMLTAADFRNKYVSIEDTIKSIKFWSFYTHSRKPAIHMIEYRKTY